MTEGKKEKEIQKRRDQQRLDLERLRNMTEQEKKRYFEKRRRQRELERERRQREFKKESAERRRERAPIREQRRLELEQRRKEFKEEEEEAGGFQIFRAKYALGASEEQWKLIQPKLEKVQQLRDQARSGIGTWVVSSSENGTGPGKPAFQWKKPWKDRSADDLTEAQKLAQRLRTLLEHANQVREAIEQRRLEKRKLAHEHIAQMAREAWKNELRVSERQWQIIEPKKRIEELVAWTTWARASSRIRSLEHFEWCKPTEDRGGGHPLPKTPEELTEAERIVCELVDLVRQEDPNDAELRQKIDALQQVREKARKELPKVKRDLAAVLKTPRQEAVFLLMGSID